MPRDMNDDEPTVYVAASLEANLTKRPLAKVVGKDGRTAYGFTRQDDTHTNVEHYPHDPNVLSPMWFENAEIATITVDDAATQAYWRDRKHHGE